ncbi:MAG TPA: hypothetical protein VGB02_05765 [Pyrinomonadaceae bacterium]|jgi:hypothetical protein
MPFTKYALDELYSQNISQLTECSAPEVVKYFSQSEHWVANFFLNSVFGCPIDQNGRAFSFAYLRRAETAFLEYEIARKFLVDFINSNHERPSLYLKSLTHFEVTITMVYQAYQLLMRISEEKLFQNNDGSLLERLHKIYNLIRHFNPFELPSKHFHAMWITNDGLQIENCSLSFQELKEIMIEIGEFADRVSEIRKK